MPALFRKKPSPPMYLLLLLIFCNASLYAGEVVLKNGDRLKSEKIEESQDSVKIHHDILGDLFIPKNQITSISREPAKPAETEKKEKERKKGDVTLDRRLAAGYAAKRGNTDTDSLNGDFLFNRNRLWIDEWTVKGEAAQEYNQDKKTSQRAGGSLRYARSITQKFYHFYRLGAEHDRFEDVDLRLTPTAGLGYWFWDKETLKLMGETGLGYEYEFRREAEDEGAPIAHFRESFSKKIGNVEFGEDIYFFPHLNDFSDYRLEGEAYLRFILSKHLALKFKAADQYRSEPAEGKKKNDLQFTSSVEWLF